MQLEQIVVSMRSRTGYEAMDLGFALVRNGARDIYKALAVLMLPVVAIALGIYQLDELSGFVFLWWVKPVMNAVTLSVLGRSLIGERVGIREVFMVAPRALQSHLLGGLTWRRFSPSRTFTMPVRHLEGLTGKSASERLQTLASTHRGSAQLACFACTVFELGLFLGGLQAVQMFAPQSTLVRTELFSVSPPDWLLLLLLALAHFVIEPIFSGIGFALYINRRVDLEGWDLELAFRALRSRVGRRPVASMVAALLVAVLPVIANAQTPATDVDEAPVELVGPRTPPTKAIKEILSEKDFDNYKDVMTWQRSDEEKPEDDEVEEDEAYEPPPFIGIGAVLAEMMPYILGALGVVLVVHLTLVLLRNRTTKSGTSVVTNTPFDEEWSPRASVPLPDDVVAYARAAFERGEAALALSILYRGAIAVLAREASIDFPEGATEQECVVIVRSKDVEPALRDAFESVARTWQRCAYAHRLPEHDAFNALCDRYASVIAPYKRPPVSEVAA